MFLTKDTIENYSLWLSSIFDEGAAAFIDKDKGWTSFDIVAKMRRITGVKKVGHAGTLDPLATGLLLIFLGKATKTISEYQNLSKNYTAVLKFGSVTKSYDAETEEIPVSSANDFSREQLVPILEKFTGKIMQKPPIYSAKQIQGKRFYNLARKNIQIDIQPAEINIFDIRLLEFEMPFVKIDVECSKGTYIRSLAYDIGECSGYGAYLFDLRRTRIGDFRVEDSLKIEEIIQAAK